MNEQTIQAINQWASQVQNAIVHAAPKVWQIAVTVKRADSIGELVTNGIAVLLCIVVMLAVVRPIRSTWTAFLATAKPWKSEYESADAHFNYNLFFPLGVYLAILIIAFCTAYSFAQPFFEQWVWIGATNPDLAVSHDVILKVLSQ